MKLCWDNIENLVIPKRKHAKIDFKNKITGGKYYIYKCDYCNNDCLVNKINLIQNKKNFCDLSCANKFRDHPKGKNHPSYGKPNPTLKKNHFVGFGSDNPNWKGGISKRKITKKYHNWRKYVFERDDYTCQECYKRGVYLEAHHIKKYSKYPKLIYVINNGITLCKKCHILTRGKEHLFEQKYQQILFNVYNKGKI